MLHRTPLPALALCLFLLLCGCRQPPAPAPASGAAGSSSLAMPAPPAESAAPAPKEEPAPQQEEPRQETPPTGTVTPSAVTVNPPTGGLPAESTSSSGENPPAPTARPTAYVYTPKASGETVLGSSNVSLDVSNRAEGYVMIRYSGSNPKVKIQITRQEGTTYTYDVKKPGEYEVFPLTQGSGSYTIQVFENLTGNQYAQLCSEKISVTLRSSLLPFLYPNQYVNFTASSQAVKKGGELAAGTTDSLEVVEKVYTYVIKNIAYDFEKAANATAGSLAGYLPQVDDTLATGKGICFDYGALMTAMLRSQGIPTKLVIGYAGDIYHCWINVYLEEVGWVNGIIYFDGQSWVRMDPTFASSGNSSSEIMQYIGNGQNYQALYLY